MSSILARPNFRRRLGELGSASDRLWLTALLAGLGSTLVAAYLFPGSESAALASLLVGVGAGVTVGFYEYYAWLAGWWRYEPAHAMIGPYCALFVPLGELFMFLAILPIAAVALDDEEHPTAAAIAGGARFAGAIAAGYALAYLLLEVGRPVG